VPESSVPQSSSSATAQRPRQFQHLLANGMALVAERIPGVQSAAMTFVVPAGAAGDPRDAGGSAMVLSDWIIRGAGERDSRQLSAHLDGLGVQRGCQAETLFTRMSASMLGANLLQVLPVYADIVQRPRLPEEGSNRHGTLPCSSWIRSRMNRRTSCRCCCGSGITTIPTAGPPSACANSSRR